MSNTKTAVKTKFVHHPVKDNSILIENKVYYGVNVDMIAAGVESSDPNRTEILKNDEGYFYSRVAVDAQEVFNRKTQKNSGWFLLDLETGQNPKRYFPGCEIHGTIAKDVVVEVKEEPTPTSLTIATLSGAIVRVHNIKDLTDRPKDNYYKISFNDYIGYIPSGSFSKLVYEAPF